MKLKEVLESDSYGKHWVEKRKTLFKTQLYEYVLVYYEEPQKRGSKPHTANDRLIIKKDGKEVRSFEWDYSGMSMANTPISADRLRMEAISDDHILFSKHFVYGDGHSVKKPEMFVYDVKNDEVKTSFEIDGAAYDVDVATYERKYLERWDPGIKVGSGDVPVEDEETTDLKRDSGIVMLKRSDGKGESKAVYAVHSHSLYGGRYVVSKQLEELGILALKLDNDKRIYIDRSKNRVMNIEKLENEYFIDNPEKILELPDTVIRRYEENIKKALQERLKTLKPEKPEMSEEKEPKKPIIMITKKAKYKYQREVAAHERRQSRNAKAQKDYEQQLEAYKNYKAKCAKVAEKFAHLHEVVTEKYADVSL